MDGLIQDLKQILGSPAVISAPEHLLAYEADSFSIFTCSPRAVVLPGTTEEVAAILRLCWSNGIPFTARGSGTCLSGGATPVSGGVVISLSRLDQILEIQPEDRYARVQCGLINADLTKILASHGLHYAPDPSSQAVCTLGGNIGENAGGPHCFKYGLTVNHILGLRVVLPDGQILGLGGPCGEPDLDLLGLFIGSEGTLGIATEATVKLTPTPPELRTLLASFSSLTNCSHAVAGIVAAGIVPAAMEIMDRAAIETVENSVNRAGYPRGAEAVLLIELDGRPAEMTRPLAEVQRLCQENGALQLEFAKDPEHRLKLWKGRKAVFGSSGRLAPDLYVMDGVVPRHRLAETLAEVEEITDRHQLVCCNIAHAGDGNLHPNICFDKRDPKQVEKVEAAGREILASCLAKGGTITGEHGVGMEKIELMRDLFSPEDLQVMRRVKAVFDPAGLANPGKLLPEEER